MRRTTHLLIGAGSLIALLLLVPLTAFAQSGQDAAVTGIVRDASGAVISGAHLQITGASLIGGPQQTTTGGDGAFKFSFLPPGTYEVSAEQPGFATMRRQLTLSPGLTLTLDFTLHVQALEQSADVAATAPLVDVHTSASPTIIDGHLLETLPLVRGALNLVNLAPGVTHDVGLGGTLYANPLFLDGTSANEPVTGEAILSPNLNWIGEVQVISVGADARYGEYTGVMANAITRSGSNRFSGREEFWLTRPSWSSNNRESVSTARSSSSGPSTSNSDTTRRSRSAAQSGRIGCGSLQAASVTATNIVQRAFAPGRAGPETPITIRQSGKALESSRQLRFPTFGLKDSSSEVRNT